jgi:serine/threonine protein kinase
VLSPGEILGGRYRLVRHVAAGGMGDVWQATDQLLARTVAAKVLVPALLGDPTFEVRFQVEARMLATVEHPGIVSVYDFGKCQLSTGVTVAYLVMPYVDGVPLSRWITALGRLSVGHTTSVVAQAADALHAAHRRGIVHRDVTPANLLIDRHGTVVLVDFGVAHAAAESTHGRHGAGTGHRRAGLASHRRLRARRRDVPLPGWAATVHRRQRARGCQPARARQPAAAAPGRTEAGPGVGFSGAGQGARRAST